MLNLSETQITDEALRNLTGLRELGDLNLSDTRITDGGLAHLSGLPKLHALYLRNTKVRDAGLRHLIGLNNLTYLDLSGSEVTGEALREFSGLREVVLNGNKVSGRALEGTVCLALSLRGCPIADADLPYFYAMKELRALDLRNTMVTKRGVDLLKEKLPLCRCRIETEQPKLDANRDG
jgi:Leucine-rich repeat (LRR) protein